MYTIPNLKYKTTLCHNWLEGVPCQKGINCYFAHGEEELRKIQDNQQIIANRNQAYLQYQYFNNFKTVYCRFYAKGTHSFQKGQCKLGSSCTFAHQRKQKRKLNRPYNNEQPLANSPILPYMQFSSSYFYQPYQNFQMPFYMNQGINIYTQVQNDVERQTEAKEAQKKGQIQAKSQQKRKSRTQDRSTTEKSKQDINNEEDLTKTEKKTNSFNFQ